MEWPGALTRALSLRVANPNVGKLVILALNLSSFGRSVSPAPAGAKPINGDIRGCQDDIDGVHLITL
ncbi:hypothetical protein HYC85_020234 [Camellia sinensis]|uniref:Uncharacterized protein n=1 Tax=Camellia sinensis TaxID=4442 RepID=A0A7J7GP62_CAMSI|nr:hypothetical protein HYC85_020234 [Camellia sinensis]